MTEPQKNDVAAAHDDKRPMAPGRLIGRLERSLAGVVGVLAAAAGTAAVFATDNELGTGALLITAGGFLLMSISAVVPTRLRMGDREVHLERLAVSTLTRVMHEADPDVQDTLREAFEEELASRGLTTQGPEAVEAMLKRFERYSDSTFPREVHHHLLTNGWVPVTPPKSTYIRWMYNGTQRNVSLYQNSAALVAASTGIKDMAASLPGATVRPPKQEVSFVYSAGPSTALDAADAIKRFADGETPVAQDVVAARTS